MAKQAQTTIDHDEIREWAEARDGRPSVVKGTEILRIDFGEPEESLEEISWDEFFRIFDDRKLAFLRQEEQDGSESRFFKLVSRESADEDGE